MIKAVSFLRSAGNPAAYQRLTGFLAAMGLAQGEGWKDGAIQAASFSVPNVMLELIDSPMPDSTGYPSDFYIEVSSVDAAYQAVDAWLRAQGADGLKEQGTNSRTSMDRISAIEDTHWKSRMFTAEPEPGFKISFWAWADPLRGKPEAVEGDLSAEGMKFAIVVARWNAVITDRLLEGAIDALVRSGAKRSDIEIVRVPGAWEIPNAARTIANRGSVDAIVTLGCLLRGETAHYEAIYNEVARGIGQSQQETGIPHSFGVLTCETLEQALNRAGIKAGNKGFEAATAAIEMVSLRRKLAVPQQGGRA
jgi:6,7-dimethyl-8-ribityllumazine synthase